MAKVKYQYRTDWDIDDKDTIIGFCGKCGAKVAYGRCGFDEECLKCGAALDWSENSDEEDTIDYEAEARKQFGAAECSGNLEDEASIRRRWRETWDTNVKG